MNPISSICKDCFFLNSILFLSSIIIGYVGNIFLSMSSTDIVEGYFSRNSVYSTWVQDPWGCLSKSVKI